LNYGHFENKDRCHIFLEKRLLYLKLWFLIVKVKYISIKMKIKG